MRNLAEVASTADELYMPALSKEEWQERWKKHSINTDEARARDILGKIAGYHWTAPSFHRNLEQMTAVVRALREGTET